MHDIIYIVILVSITAYKNILLFTMNENGEDF